MNKKAKLVKEDLVNHEKIKEIFEKFKPVAVYHLAAQIDLRKSMEDPIDDAKRNILATLNVLELCKNYKVKYFIFSSSAAVYGETATYPTYETDKEYPLTPYGAGKLTIEKYLIYYNTVHKLKYTVLRYSNVYGPRQNHLGEAGVVSLFITKMLKSETPKIFGGTQTRDFVFVKDVARANLLALGDSRSEIYNVSTNVETTINELFDMINELYGGKGKVERLTRREDEQLRSSLDNRKITKMLGWKPEYMVKEGLEETFEYFREIMKK